MKKMLDYTNKRLLDLKARKEDNDALISDWIENGWSVRQKEFISINERYRKGMVLSAKINEIELLLQNVVPDYGN